MTIGLLPSLVTRLEKVATDNGFDRVLAPDDLWLSFASTQAPLRIWLTALDDGRFLAALSQENVTRELNREHAASDGAALPAGAIDILVVPDIEALHHLVRRAFQLSRSLPDELLHVFERQTATLPKTTEAERLVVQRVGQEIFRAGLIEYWNGRCAATGLAVAELLRASHIKPWAACDSDAERLDVFNGLLLAPHLDALFDRGFITVANDGMILRSHALSPDDWTALGLGDSLSVSQLEPGHRSYLRFHRERVFRRRA